jgi:hypothetical protein
MHPRQEPNVNQNICNAGLPGLSGRAVQVLRRHGFASMEDVKRAGPLFISKLSGASQSAVVEICLWADMEPPEALSGAVLEYQLSEAEHLLRKHGYKIIRPGQPAMELFGPVKRSKLP